MVGTVEQEYEPTSVEEKQERRNEIKVRATLLMALPNKDQLKFHTYQDAKLLMEAIEKRNKAEIETISLDELYNNLKIYEPELTGSSSTSQNTQNVAFVSNNTNNTNSTHKGDDSSHEISTTQSTTHTNHNGSNTMAMLTIRARRFIKRTGKKLNINGQRVGFDKSKVECFNCHKHGHFARECRFPRNQEFKGRENNTRTIAVETPTQNALIAQDGIGGYDWSYQAEEEQPTNHALMAFTSSGSSSSSESEVDSCSKSCMKAYATLKEQYDNLSSDYKKSQFNLLSYKAGLESVEARLVHYKKNETVLEDSINVLKLEVRLRDNALDVYKLNLEKAKAERDQLKQTLEKFQNSSKSLNEILECQVIDKFKKGLGYDAATAASPAVEGFVNLTDKSGFDKAYHAVPPPLTGNFIPRKPDLTFIDKIVESENLDVTTVVTPSNEKTIENKGVFNTVESNTVRRECCAPINEELVSDGKKKTVVPTIPKVDVVRPKQQEKPVRKTVKYAEMYRSQKPRGNQRNWNNQKSQQLGNDFVMHNKACYVCGSFDHLQYTCKQKRQLNGQREEKPVWNNARRVNHQNSPRITHPNPKRHMVPRKILTRSGPISLNTARQSYLNAVCCCCSRQVNTARQKAVVNAVRTNRVNAVKASACWVWRPVKPNSASITLKKYNYVDARGRSSPKDEKRAGAELTQQNDKSQYKKYEKIYAIVKITWKVNAD
ncbi:ribonuclease H-like domain-containing protein [Tanacetum coccineum]|uniref:Ribonuclease H-like domain-containing protein n=1 Tax=Tanacetum coccineum TaxID=301880 RepID=A0ABQ4YRF6_9ASTR